MPFWGVCTSLPPSSRSLYISATAASLGLYLFFRSFRQSLNHAGPDVIPSPGESVLPFLANTVLQQLAYPPDALPGARDVDSPYGSIRVYEWGPKDGRKVLLIHGISTPSVALGPLAHKLVEKGCRVMLFDLFGRGYSSTPSPYHYPHNSALYTTQIHLVLASSSLPWTTTPFTLIGYSLGGALAADFTSYFPSLVSNLILLAPGGLIRTSHITWKSRLLYSTSGLIPEFLIQRLVARRLWTGEVQRSIEPEQDVETDIEAAKTGGLRSSEVYMSSSLPLLPEHPQSTVSAVVDWQIQHHRGFVPSFISAIRYAPIHGQQPRWRVIGRRLAWQHVVRTSVSSDEDVDFAEDQGLEQNKVLIVLGEKDPIIVAQEVTNDAKEVIGKEFVDARVLKSVGHEVPIQEAVAVMEIIEDFWNGGEKEIKGVMRA